jgi:RNA polymerase sigma-70 factor (ECF subfamily)
VDTQLTIESEFLELVEANRQRILRICRVYGWTPQDAEDLYQNILFQIWRGLPKLRDKAHANTWLYRVAINTGISFVRETKSVRHAVPTEPEQLLAWADHHHQANAVHEPDAQLETLHAAMAKLNQVEKGVVTLFLEDLSYEEIAEVMGMNANQVGVVLHRTKKKLFELMREVAV